MLRFSYEASCIAYKGEYHECRAESDDAVNARGRDIIEHHEHRHTDEKHGRTDLACKECAVEHFASMEQAASHDEHESLFDYEDDEQGEYIEVAEREAENDHALS